MTKHHSLNNQHIMKDNKQISALCRKPYAAPSSESIRLFAEDALLEASINVEGGGDDDKVSTVGGSDFDVLSTGRKTDNPIWKNMN